MDETAACLFQGSARGNMLLEKIRGGFVQNGSHGQRRKYPTLLAFICDDEAFQPLLPQVFIANENAFPTRDLAGLRSLCPPIVLLLRGASAWINGGLLAQIIRWLEQPLLLYEACTQHLVAAVFTACSTAGIWPIVVPARTTWLLRLLDAHGFFCPEDVFAAGVPISADSLG